MTMQPSQSLEQTVNLRVQVIDMQSFTLDLQVPTYLPAGDLTQRIARDAGLSAHWPDGRRRLYYLRARGRLLAAHERLSELGVVRGELVYLLPEPPAGAPVQEREPEYPVSKGYLAKGIPALVISIVLVLGWSVGWGLALNYERSVWTVILPGLGLGMLCANLARHAWGGEGSSPRIALTGIVLFLVITALAFAGPILLGKASAPEVLAQAIPGFITGLAGVLVAWLAWWGAVEPVPVQAQAAAVAAGPAKAVPCAICGMPVAADVMVLCPHGCGKAFHVGCHRAKLAVFRGDPRVCAICNQQVRS